MNKYIDVIVPRGGKGLGKSSKIFKYSCNWTFRGLCHIYLDKENNIKNVIKVIVNAKMKN